MTSQFTRYALYAPCWPLVNAAFQRMCKSSAAQSHEGALMTWEDEGGALS